MLTLEASPVAHHGSVSGIGWPALALRGRSAVTGSEQPISIGIPFPRGWCDAPDGLGVVDGAGRAQPCQWQVLARWPDGSTRWALLDFLARAEAGTVRRAQEAARVSVPNG
jgi:hypothetical protein